MRTTWRHSLNSDIIFGAVPKSSRRSPTLPLRCAVARNCSRGDKHSAKYASSCPPLLQPALQKSTEVSHHWRGSLNLGGEKEREVRNHRCILCWGFYRKATTLQKESVWLSDLFSLAFWSDETAKGTAGCRGNSIIVKCWHTAKGHGSDSNTGHCYTDLAFVHRALVVS